MRGEAEARQVPGARVGLQVHLLPPTLVPQHNLGLGGAVVVALYRMGFPQEQKVLAKL